MRILLIEDDQDARELLSLMLASHQVEAFATIDEALASITVTPPDLIVSDLRVGRDTARRMVDELVRQELEIPVLIVSGLLATDDEPVGLIKAFLTKPFESATLLSAVESAMQESKSEF